jgi:hypothetical protein
MEILPQNEGISQRCGPSFLDLQLVRQMILREIHWPLTNRPYVTSICAISYGRGGWFPYGHEFVAAVQGYEGSEEANRKRVQRDLLEFERAQIQVGRRLFEFKRGGSAEKAITQYGHNFLNLAADQIRARVGVDTDAIPTAAKIDKYLLEAIELLPAIAPPKPRRKSRLKVAAPKCPLSKTLPPLLSALGRDAVELAREGYFVLPLHSVTDGVCSCKKGAECPWPGKHPRIGNWLTARFPSVETIIAWWLRWPDANVGIRTGVKLKNGEILVVLDCDRRSFGHGTLAQVEEEVWEQTGERLPITFTVTSGDGFHNYFSVPAHLVGNTITLGRGLDIKAKGGLVVARGLHRSGRSYEVSLNEPIARMPDALIQLIFENQKQPPKIVTVGDRHKFLLRCGSKLAGLGLSQDEILMSLRDRRMLCEKGERPIDDKELTGIARWAFSKERANSREGVRVA